MRHSRITSPQQSFTHTKNPETLRTSSAKTDSTQGTITVNSALLFLLEDKQENRPSDDAKPLDDKISHSENNVNQINQTNNGLNSGPSDYSDYVIPSNQDNNNKKNVNRDVCKTTANNHECDNDTINRNIISRTSVNGADRRTLQLISLTKNNTDKKSANSTESSVKFGSVVADNSRQHRSNVKTYCAVNLDVLKASGLKLKESGVLLSTKHTRLQLPVDFNQRSDSSYPHIAAIKHYTDHADLHVTTDSYSNGDVSRFVSLSDKQERVRDKGDCTNKRPIYTTSHMEQSEATNRTTYMNKSPAFAKDEEDEYRFVSSSLGEAPVAETVYSTYRELDRNTLPEPHYHYAGEHASYPPDHPEPHTDHKPYTAEDPYKRHSQLVPEYQTTDTNTHESSPDVNIATTQDLYSGPAVNEGHGARFESNMTAHRDNDYSNEYYADTGIDPQTRQYSIEGANPYLNHSATTRLSNNSQKDAARNINVNEPTSDHNTVHQPDFSHSPQQKVKQTVKGRQEIMPPRELTLASEHSLPGENLTYSPSQKRVKTGSAEGSTDSKDNGNNSEDSSGSNKNQRVGFNLGQRGRSQDEELLQLETYYQQELKNRIDEQRVSVERIEIPRLDLPNDSVESFSRNNYRKQIADIICDSLDAEDDSDVEDNGGVYPGVEDNGGVYPGVEDNGGVYPGVEDNGGVYPGVEDNGGVYPGAPPGMDVVHMDKKSTSHSTPTLAAYGEMSYAANPFILHDTSHPPVPQMFDNRTGDTSHPPAPQMFDNRTGDTSHPPAPQMFDNRTGDTSHPPAPQMFDHRTGVSYQSQSGADPHALVNPGNQYGQQVYGPTNQLQNLYISNPQSYQQQHQIQQQQEQLQYQLQQQEQQYLYQQQQQQHQQQQHQQQQQHIGPLSQHGLNYYQSDPNQNIQPFGGVYGQMVQVPYPQGYANNRYEDMNVITQQMHAGNENLQTDPSAYAYNQTLPEFQEEPSIYATEDPDRGTLNTDTDGGHVEDDERINYVEANKDLSFVFKESKITKTYKQILEEKKKLVDKTVMMTQKPSSISPRKLQKANQEAEQNAAPLVEPASTVVEHAQHDSKVKPSSAEQLWQKRAQSLSLSKDKKNLKNGKKKQSLLTKYPSDSAMYNKATGARAGHQSTFKANQPPPPPHLQPIANTKSVPYYPVSAQSAPTISRTDPNGFRRPIQLKPISQEVWTDDGQRISVDINLKLLSPPPAPLLGPIIGPARNTSVPLGVSNLEQPSPWLHDVDVDGNRMERVDMNRLASFPQPQHHQQQPDYDQQQWYYEPEDVYPSPRERLASDPVVSPRVPYNHAVVGSPPTRGRFQKVPPIPHGKLSLTDLRSDDGSYADQYYKQKNKQFTYKVYNLEDYRKMQKEVQLGGLGPEMDNETYKEKAEKLEKQKAYARAVQNKNKRISVHTKPPKFPRPKEMDDLMSKRRVAIEYAKNLPRPKIQIQPNEFNSYQMASTASTTRSPMGGTPRSMSLRSSPKLPPSPPKPIDVIDLQRLHERHEQDKYNVALIRQNIENIT